MSLSLQHAKEPQHKQTINCFLSNPCPVLSPQGTAINTDYVTFLKVLSKEQYSFTGTTMQFVAITLQVIDCSSACC